MARDSTRLKFEQKCKDCEGSDFVEDHAQGNLVCTNCGLIAESRMIDERSEWRTFGDKDGTAGADPNRVGGPVDHLLSNDLTTDIIQGRGTATLAQTLKRTAGQAGGDPDKALNHAFRKVRELCGSLGLSQTIVNTARELYKKVAEAGIVKGRSVASIAAAVVFIACRKENLARTFREILMVAPDTNKKEVAKSFKLITTRLENEQPLPTAHVTSYMGRFCSQLGLKHRDRVAAEEFALAACPKDGRHPGGGTRPWDGKSPLSIAAAVLLIISRMPKSAAMPSVQDIADVAMVAEVTVRTTAQMLFPYAAELMPATWASKKDTGRVIEIMRGNL